MGDPKIWTALDVDGVLYRWGRSVRRVLKDRYNLNISEEDWFGEEHVSPEQWAWIWSDAGVHEIFGGGDAFPGAVQFAKRLYKISRVRILTACPEAAQRVRVDWLRQVGIPYDDIVFVKPPPLQTGVGTDGVTHASKSDVLPHCDVYIDDNASNVLELADNTQAKKIILVDHSWNRGIEHAYFGRIQRSMSWAETLKIVKEVAGD